MERCRDFHVVELNVQPFDRSNVPDMQELVSSRELGFQLSERVALDVGQLDVEMDELRRTRRRRACRLVLITRGPSRIC